MWGEDALPSFQWLGIRKNSSHQLQDQIKSGRKVKKSFCQYTSICGTGKQSLAGEPITKITVVLEAISLPSPDSQQIEFRSDEIPGTGTAVTIGSRGSHLGFLHWLPKNASSPQPLNEAFCKIVYLTYPLNPLTPLSGLLFFIFLSLNPSLSPGRGGGRLRETFF